MEMLCPECMGHLIAYDGKYARCSLHGGKYRILFTRLQSSEKSLNNQQREVFVAKPATFKIVSSYEKTGATSNIYNIVKINCTQCGNQCIFKTTYFGEKIRCPNCNSICSMDFIGSGDLRPDQMQEARKSEDKAGTNLMCKNHPSVQAKYVCCICAIPVCETCSFKTSDGRNFCPECAVQNSQGILKYQDSSKPGLTEGADLSTRGRFFRYPNIYCRCGKRMIPVFEDDGPVIHRNILLTCDDYILGCKNHDSLILKDISEEEAKTIEQERREEGQLDSSGLGHSGEKEGIIDKNFEQAGSAKSQLDIIQKNISNLSDSELLRMVNNDFDDYTEEAINFAKEELRDRDLEDAVECPVCGLINPGSAQMCDCGYNFLPVDQIGDKEEGANADWKCPLCDEINDGCLLKCSCGYERDLKPISSGYVFQNYQAGPESPGSFRSHIPTDSQISRTLPGIMCREHVDVPAVQICKICGEGVCKTCDFVFSGNVHLCPKCVTKPKKVMTEKRKKMLVWSFILAVWTSFGLLLMISGALRVFVTSKEDLEALGTIILLFIYLPSIIGTALGFSSFDRRLSNPLSVWIASIWNAIILIILILLSLIGAFL